MIKKRLRSDAMAEEFGIEVLSADGFDDAFIGLVERASQEPILVYDREATLQILMERNGMAFDDAVEWYEFNIAGAWVGQLTPASFIPASGVSVEWE